MPRYVALLRGVSPMNARMPELKACFESVGFTDVKTLLSSGNVVFSSSKRTERSVISAIESGMATRLSRSFPVILRTTEYLRTLLDSDPYAGFRIPANAKRVVTFLSQSPETSLALPIEFDGAQIVVAQGREVFSAYVASDRGPVFMTLIEKTFGKSVTTRTWDTVRKCAMA